LGVGRNRGTLFARAFYEIFGKPVEPRNGTYSLSINISPEEYESLHERAGLKIGYLRHHVACDDSIIIPLLTEHDIRERRRGE